MIARIHAQEATLTLTLEGRLDAEGAQALRPAVEDLANGGTPRVVLDLAGVGFMDGAGLGALAFLAKRLPGRISLSGVTGQPLDLLRHLGLDRVFGLPAGRRTWLGLDLRTPASFAWGGSVG